MSRPTPSRQVARSGRRTADSAPHAVPAPRTLLSVLVAADRLSEVLPHLHQHALDLTGGTRALLFEHDARTGVLRASSGYGLRELRTDPWDASEAEGAIVSESFTREGPTLVADLERQMPDLAVRLGAMSALLVPIVHGSERIGILTVGFHEAPDVRRLRHEINDIGDAFATALELFRLRHQHELQHDLRDLLDEFTASLATSLDIESGLEYFCHGANRLFAADRTSVWLHDRRTRELVLHASSDSGHLANGVRVSADDAFAPAAVAMRQARAELVDVTGATTDVVTVPLRGCRRALGTLLFEGVRIETGRALDLLDRADEIGRQVSTAIETMQLLDEVRRAKRDIENPFDSISHLVAVTDAQGRIVHANEALTKRLKVSRERLLHRPLVEFVGGPLREWLASLDRQNRPPDGPPAVCELEDESLNGTFVVTVTSLRTAERHEMGRVLIARDLKPHSTVEIEQEELRTQLTQSEKLAALGQFVAGIAHELNNPLQSVLGHLELLRASGAIDRTLRPQVHTISREADRAAKIVRNLLIFAGSGRLARRSVSVNALLRRVVSLRQRACRLAEIEIVRHYDETLPRIKSDPLMLHQVFLNMLVNAEQAVIATGRPGRIEITTSTTDAGRRVVATMRDTGAGIPAEALSRVFEPFYTTKDVGKGTGLGLAIAYGIVHDHGGDIHAANHPDGGAIFTVELPCGTTA